MSNFSNWFNGRDPVGRAQRLSVTDDGRYYLSASEEGNLAEISVEQARVWMRANGYSAPPYLAEELFGGSSKFIEEEAMSRFRREIPWYRRNGIGLAKIRRRVLEEQLQDRAVAFYGHRYMQSDLEAELRVWNDLVQRQKMMRLVKTAGAAAVLHHWSDVANGRRRGWF